MQASANAVVAAGTYGAMGSANAAETYDAIVVGAGPGGSTTAAYLARAGAKVLLLDRAKFPRDKVCGDALSGKAMAVVKDFGLEAQIEQSPHGRINGCLFSSPDKKIIEIPFARKDGGGRPAGYSVRREVSDNVFFQYAKKQVARTIEGAIATDLIMDGDKVIGVKVRDTNDGTEKEFHAKLIIGADGVTSMVARKVGVGDLPPEHTCIAVRAYFDGIAGMKDFLEIHFLDEALPGYFWIFPLENGKANVGLGMIQKDITAQKIQLAPLMERIVRQNPLFAERFKNAKQLTPTIGWTLPFGSKIRKAYGNGYMLVGDAASLVDPFSGEGFGNATTSGKIAARIGAKAIMANDTSEHALSEYQRELEAELKAELDTSYTMQKLGKQKWLLNLVIGKAHKSPEIRELISGMLSKEEAKKELKSPLFYLKLLFA
jgi:geranylgeranyl reductase family protein